MIDKNIYDRPISEQIGHLKIMEHGEHEESHRRTGRIFRQAVKGMTLYRKLIRPMHCYPGHNYEPLTEPVEKEEKWYPEEEREHLVQKYGYLDKESFSDLVFDVKYEPYAVEPQFKKLRVPEKCKECKSCQAAITGSPYCNMEAITSKNPQMGISTIYVDVNSRPVWCPIVKMNKELNEMPVEKRSKFDELITGLTFLWGGEDLWE